MKIIWTTEANIDRVDIYDYIEAESPQNAVFVDNQILKWVATLATFPEVGRLGRDPGTRERIIGDTGFIVSYRINRNSIDILGVYRATRNEKNRTRTKL